MLITLLPLMHESLGRTKRVVSSKLKPWFLLSFPFLCHFNVIRGPMLTPRPSSSPAPSSTSTHTSTGTGVSQGTVIFAGEGKKVVFSEDKKGTLEQQDVRQNEGKIEENGKKDEGKEKIDDSKPSDSSFIASTSTHYGGNGDGDNRKGGDMMMQQPSLRVSFGFTDSLVISCSSPSSGSKSLLKDIEQELQDDLRNVVLPALESPPQSPEKSPSRVNGQVLGGENQRVSEGQQRQSYEQMMARMQRDAQTQKDADTAGGSDSSLDQPTVIENNKQPLGIAGGNGIGRSRSFFYPLYEEDVTKKKPGHHYHHHHHGRYLSRSKSPCRKKKNPYQTRIEPAISPNIDVYGILENVAKSEGSFVVPDEALRASIAAFTQDTWTTKVEGMLAISRLATFHPSVLARELHTVILALVYEVKNLRSTVARSAIFTLGDLLVKMKKHVEPVSDCLVNDVK